MKICPNWTNKNTIDENLTHLEKLINELKQDTPEYMRKSICGTMARSSDNCAILPTNVYLTFQKLNNNKSLLEYYFFGYTKKHL